MNEVPQRAGFYWARWKDDKDFTLIVNITGEAPFLWGRAWDMVHDTLFAISSLMDDIKWGPQILRPGETGTREA